MPGPGGFISATGQAPLKKSTIDNFTPINQPIMENSVVQKLLRQSKAATAEVGQKYTINTFDLRGCMKALRLRWKSPGQIKSHVVLPGQFHTGMNYIGMINGHKCQGSGYPEILFDVKHATISCMKNILSGKAYMAKHTFASRQFAKLWRRCSWSSWSSLKPPQLDLRALTCKCEKLDLPLKDPPHSPSSSSTSTTRTRFSRVIWARPRCTGSLSWTTPAWSSCCFSLSRPTICNCSM